MHVDVDPADIPMNIASNKLLPISTSGIMKPIIPNMMPYNTEHTGIHLDTSCLIKFLAMYFVPWLSVATNVPIVIIDNSIQSILSVHYIHDVYTSLFISNSKIFNFLHIYYIIEKEV